MDAEPTIQPGCEPDCAECIAAVKPLPRVRIVNTSGVGYKTRVYIDDVDVSACFSNVLISVDIKDAVSAQMTAQICEFEVDGVRVDEMFVEAGRDLLIATGWTPPAPVDAVVEVQPAVELDG